MVFFLYKNYAKIKIVRGVKMYCFRCGTKVSENTKYCPHCGADIIEELKRYSYPIDNKNMPKEEPKRINQTHSEQYLYSLKYSFGDDDTLIRAYVGNNYDNIKKQSFSFATFFFGPIYFLYRKLYILGLCYIILSVILSPIAIILHIGISIGFKYIYFNTVKKRVDKIKLENKNMDKETILNICKKKGGVNILIAIICIIIPIVLIVTNIITTTSSNTNTLEDNDNYYNVTENNEFSIQNLSYTIPQGFNAYDYDFLKRYSLYTDNNYCTIKFTTTTYITTYDNEEDYIKDNVYTEKEDIVFPIDTVTLSNREWKHMKIQSTYSLNNIYVLKTEEEIYEIETREGIDDNTCTPYFEQILASLTYKE